ncbi:MAG: cation transporter [Candidatus Aenigmarchaeota archaeon]|nr:cation transporter [Candidatus Aenigmarchaeota archaeon]
MKVKLKTKGMHCVSCERVIQDILMEIDGVKNAKANYANEKTEINFDPEKTNVKKIMKAIEKVGYEPEEWKEEEEKKGFLKKLFGG